MRAFGEGVPRQNSSFLLRQTRLQPAGRDFWGGHRPPAPKCEKRPAAIHPSPQTHIAARDERRRSPAERTSALRSLLPMLFLAEQKICSSNDRVPAASRHLSANADSTAFLLGFRRSYLFTVTLHHHHRLRQRSGRHANVVCRISSLLHDHRLRSLGLELGRRHSTIASLCH